MADIVTELCMVENATIALLEQIKVLKTKVGCSRVTMSPPSATSPVHFAERSAKAWATLRNRYKKNGHFIRTAGLANNTFYFMRSDGEPFSREVFGIIKTEQYVIITSKPYPIWELRKFRPVKFAVDRELEGQKGGARVKIGDFTFHVVYSSNGI